MRNKDIRTIQVWLTAVEQHCSLFQRPAAGLPEVEVNEGEFENKPPNVAVGNEAPFVMSLGLIVIVAEEIRTIGSTSIRFSLMPPD